MKAHIIDYVTESATHDCMDAPEGSALGVQEVEQRRSSCRETELRDQQDGMIHFFRGP